MGRSCLEGVQLCQSIITSCLSGFPAVWDIVPGLGKEQVPDTVLKD